MDIKELKNKLREEREKGLEEITKKVQEIEEKRADINRKLDNEIKELLGTDYIIVTKIEPIP